MRREPSPILRIRSPFLLGRRFLAKVETFAKPPSDFWFLVAPNTYMNIVVLHLILPSYRNWVALVLRILRFWIIGNWNFRKADRFGSVQFPSLHIIFTRSRIIYEEKRQLSYYVVLMFRLHGNLTIAQKVANEFLAGCSATTHNLSWECFHNWLLVEYMMTSTFLLLMMSIHVLLERNDVYSCW